MEDHSISQRALAEFIGTALLVFIGAGSVPAILLLERAPRRRSQVQTSVSSLSPSA